MRVPFAVALALAVASTAVLSGCTGDADDDLGRLQIVLLIPGNLFAFDFKEMRATATNITATNSARETHEWKPTNSHVVFRSGRDALVFDDQVPIGTYRTFDFWVEDVEGEFENGTKVSLRTETFGGVQGRISPQYTAESEVSVVAAGQITFQVQTAVTKQGENYVWG